MTTVKCADRLELIIIFEDKDGYVRVGPIVTSDSDVLRLFKVQCEGITTLEVNPFPHKSTLAGVSLEIVCVCSRSGKTERFRITGAVANDLILLSYDEHYRGTLPSSELFSRIEEMARQLRETKQAAVAGPWN